MIFFVIRKLRVGLFIFILLSTACAPIIPASRASTPMPNSLATKPPAASLTIDGKTQEAGIGSYCWSSKSGFQNTRLCADMVGLPTASEPLLSLNTPFTASFQLPLETPPDSLYISVMPAVNEIDSTQASVRTWQPAEGWSDALPLKSEVEYEFQESPGLYLFQLNARWQEYGDVSYGFLVQVGETTDNLPVVVTPSGDSTASAPAPVSLNLISPIMRLGKGVVTTIEPSPDGQWLAIATSLGVYLYDTGNFTEVWFRTYDSSPRYLAFSPDSSQLAIGLAGNVLPIVNVDDGKVVFELKGEEGIHGVWSPDGTSILTSGGCDEILVWDARSAQVTQTIQSSKCNNVEPGFVNAQWSWDGKRIYANSNYGYVSAWSTDTYQPLEGYTATPPEYAFGFDFASSPTQNIFALENGLSVAILDGESGEILKQLESKDKATPFNHLDWSPDGKQLLADEYLWGVETGNLIRVYDNFVSLAWLPNGSALVGLSIADGTLEVVSASSAKALDTLEGFGAINGYGAVPLWDGDTLLTYNGVSEIRWDPIMGKMLEQHRVPEPSWVSTEYAALSPDGQRRASPNGISDVNSNHQIILLDDQPEHDRDKVAWSPDGKRLVSGDSLGIADTVVWDSVTGNVLQRLSLEKNGYQPYLGALSWSPKRAWITAAGSLMNMANGFDEGMVVIWDANTGQQLQLLMAGMKSERMVSAAWSPDQHWLAAGSTSGKIFLWDMQTFIPVAVMEGHQDQVLSLAWSENGSLLSSSSMDGTVLIWKLP